MPYDGSEAIEAPGLDGVPVRLHDFGGNGPPLLFAHATGMHGLTWKPVAEHLTDRFHCWALDLRGHGDSALPAGDTLDWAGFGRDVQAALAAIGEPAVVGVGHSLGAVALILAELAVPGSFRELFLYEPAMRGDVGAPAPEILRHQDMMVRAAAARRAVFPSRAEALENYARKRPMSTFQAGALLAYVQHGLAARADGTGEATLKCRPEVEARTYAQSYTHDAAARLGEMACPTRLAMGSLTDESQRAAVYSVAKRIGAPVVELDWMDHFGPLQLPGRVAAAIAEYPV